MESQNEIIERVKCIFDSFLQENFVTTNVVYFEKLITHLSAKENAFLLQAPFAMDWVDRCITLICEDLSKVNPQVTSFILNFCALLTLDEWILIQIKERKILGKCFFFIERDMHKFTPSIKLSSIRLMSAVCRYSLGLAYMRFTKSWRILLNYCNNDHTLYVVREARQLLYELLYKFSVKTNEEQVVLEILNEIVLPIKENVYEEHNENITVNVDDAELQQKLSSTLDLLSYIFQQTLESEQKSNISHLCTVHHKLGITLWKLVEMTQNQHFLLKILSTITSHTFAKLVYEKSESGQIAPENFSKFGLCFFNTMKFCVGRRECLNFLKLAELNFILWKKLGPCAPKEVHIQDERVRFENQVTIFMLLPILFILRSKEFKEEEIFDSYVMKLFSISSEHTLRICYAYRDLLVSTRGGCVTPFNANLAYKSIQSILSMANILDRDQAVLVFQTMVYALKEFIHSSNKKSGAEEDQDENSESQPLTELVVEIPNVLYAALVGLQTLIERYRLTWNDTIETICVVNCAMTILKNSNLVTRLTVQALKLLQLSIEHFLSPNMALLVNNLQGSSLVYLGPIIMKRFNDSAWEVRDSTLELVTSIANISRLKFPAFQQFLVDFKMCPIVYLMVKNDSEPYVRASALKCLAQMISINVIWEQDLVGMDLIEHLFYVLYNDSEGIVRKEAISTLSKIYDSRKIPNQYRNTLYSTLAYCVVSDLHWEVKIHALHFWELEIQKQFTNQGMIDGTFPTVTFSKEKKKIVTLTEKEINLRIVKVFNELSQLGCLGVILKCLNDDCDLEVIKVAVCLVHRLLEKLKNYDYECIINGMDGAEDNSNILTSNSEAAEQQTEVTALTVDDNAIALNADKVIEDILSAQDFNLLTQAYETNMDLNGDEQKAHIDEHFYRQYSSVSAKEFITTVKSIDLDQLLRVHHEWFICAESFVSLLDDIIFAIKPSTETNVADCY